MEEPSKVQKGLGYCLELRAQSYLEKATFVFD